MHNAGDGARDDACQTSVVSRTGRSHELDGAVVHLDEPVAQADGGEGRVDVALEVVVGARQHVDHVAAAHHSEHPAVRMPRRERS